MGGKQGRIHSNPVADGWAGAVMRKPLGTQKCDGWTDGLTDLPTNQHGKVQSRVSVTKNSAWSGITGAKYFPSCMYFIYETARASYANFFNCQSVCLSVCLSAFVFFCDKDLEIQGETETKTERLVSVFISPRCYLHSHVKKNDLFQTLAIFYQNIPA